MNWRWLYFLFALALGVLPSPALACSICFGDPGSPVAQGVVMGVLALLGVVLAVLGGFIAFFVYIARRASSTAARATESSETIKQL
jgi:hypothetical protein